MKSMLRYRGYYGTVEYPDEDECSLGKVFRINDVILFRGNSVKALKADFHEAMDSYPEFHEGREKEPGKFYKSSFNIRVALELYKGATLTMEQRHQTLNSFVESAICTMVFTTL